MDGVVLEGRSSVDESMITGESMPVEKSPESKVIGATINGTGSFVMRAERVGSETLLARIVQLVGQAQRSRAPIQRLADLVAGWFVPVVIAVAVITFLAWWLLGRNRARARARQRSRRAYHRLPLRPRSRHPHGNHGWCRPRRPAPASLSRMRRRWRFSKKSTHWSSTKPEH